MLLMKWEIQACTKRRLSGGRYFFVNESVLLLRLNITCYQDIVILLLQRNADVKVINGEGRLARHMTPTNEIGDEIKDLLRAAEATESLRKVQ